MPSWPALRHGHRARPAGAATHKAVVEVAVQIAERWILARLRHETFFTLAALNARIAELLEDLNTRPMRRYGAKPPPALRTSRPAGAAPAAGRALRLRRVEDRGGQHRLHVEVDHHYYSVPHGLVHERLDARLTATTVELFRVASAWRPTSAATRAAVHDVPRAHPKAHSHLEWTPVASDPLGGHDRAADRGVGGGDLGRAPHPEQGYRRVLGSCGWPSATDRGAGGSVCRAGAVGARSYRHVDAILQKGLDRLALATPPAAPPPAPHENVRAAPITRTRRPTRDAPDEERPCGGA